MNKLPKAKTENIVVQDLRDELLVYNLATHQAFTLNKTAKAVFNACDGQQTFNNLKAEHQLTDEIIYLALDELKKKSLIESEYVSPFAGSSRREVIRRIGLASLIALPVVASLVAPWAVDAASSVRGIGAACTLAPSVKAAAVRAAFASAATIASR